MAEVKQFNEYKAREELKKCPKIVRDYVKLLEKHYEKQKELTGKAISKLKSMSNPERVKCSNCDELVDMVQTGTMCPRCYC